MTKDEQLQHIRDLISVARDGELGYRTAAEHVNDEHLATIFSEYAKERAGFVRALEAEVERVGGSEASESGTATGAIFRGWIRLKAAVTGGDSEAIIAACETGEDSAAAAFERVVNSDVTGETRTLIERQWAKIKEAHQRMLHLKGEI